MASEREARATILQTLKGAGGTQQIDILAASLGLRLRAAVEDLMAEGLVMPTAGGFVSLTPRGRHMVDNLGEVKIDG